MFFHFKVWLQIMGFNIISSTFLLKSTYITLNVFYLIIFFHTTPKNLTNSLWLSLTEPTEWILSVWILKPFLDLDLKSQISQENQLISLISSSND